jgi:hypothetical protein
VQTADDHLLVSRDSETTTDEEISHICPSLIHFVVTLEQQFITIDDLLTEEAINPFTDNATDPFDGSASSVSKEQLCIPLSARDTRNSMPFAPLWIIFSVMCAPPFDFSGSWGDFHRSNDGYSIDPLVLEPQHGSTCISAKVDIQVLMCLLARLSIGLSICNGSLIVACDDHPLLSMHHLGHQSFPSVKYKQIQHNGTTSSFEPSTDYDTVNVINLEWICQDPFGIKIKQVQCDGVAFSLFNVDVMCAHHETSQMLTRTSFPITLIADANKGGLKSKEGIAQSILYGARAPIGTRIVEKLHPASSASAALGSSVFSSMKGLLICGPKENGIFLQGTTTPLCASALLCVDPSMATTAQSSCHLTLLKAIETMANSFSYRDLMIDRLYGTKVLISPAPMGRDELSGSIFRQHFLLVTSPDSDGTVLPFDRGPAKLLTASMQSLKLLPFDRGPTSHLLILQAILEISFKMMILFRYSSYRNYLLRYMYINFLGNRPQADGE